MIKHFVIATVALAGISVVQPAGAEELVSVLVRRALA